MELIGLETKFLGRNVYYHKTIDSTQSEIFRLIENSKVTNGDIVIADIQTKGKGTHGRVWHTDEKRNIAFSIYVNLNCSIHQIEGITIDIAKIIIGVFKTKYKINLYIKEPNDIMFNNKKIGGILTQSKVIAEKVKYIVVGIGINTNKEKFSDDIKDIATSIKKEFNIEISREEFIVEFCNQFEQMLFKKIKIRKDT